MSTLAPDKTTPPAETAGAGRGPRRRNRIALLISLLVLALLVGAVALVANILRGSIDDNLTRSDLLPGNQLPGTPGTSGFPLPPAPGDGAAAATGAMNFLIIGADASDTADTRPGASRSDVIILAHLSADKKRLDLIHFPRDYWVPIRDRGVSKINHSYAWGGAPLLIDTVQNLAGVQIDHAVSTGFGGFENSIDEVGGLDLTIKESAPARNGYGPYTKGETVHMGGREALYYARERTSLSQGDISRGQRQMDVVTAFGKKVASPDVVANPAKLQQVLAQMSKNLVVDQELDATTMARMVIEARDARSNTHQWTAPWTGTSTHDGMSTVEAAQEQLAVLRTALQTDTMAGYSDPVSPKRGF